MRERERKEREAQGGAVSVSSGGGGGGRASPPNPRNATVIKPFDGTFEWDKVSTMVSLITMSLMHVSSFTTPEKLGVIFQLVIGLTLYATYSTPTRAKPKKK